MKRIRNPNLANVSMNIGGQVLTGDVLGTFEVADDARADAMLQTPGWEPADSLATEENYDPLAAVRAAAGAPPKPVSVPAAPAPTPAAPVSVPEEPGAGLESPDTAPTEPPEAPDSPEEPAETETPKDAPEGEGEEEGPDLDAIETKAGLYKVAKEYEIKLSASQKKKSVADIRKILDAEIYGGE